MTAATSEPIRPEMLHAHASMMHAGDRRNFINDEGHQKGPRSMAYMQEAEDVTVVIEPVPLTARAGQYVRRLRRLDAQRKHAQRSSVVGAW